MSEQRTFGFGSSPKTPAEAEARMAEGIGRTVAHAEREEPNWVAQALDAVRRGILSIAEPFTWEALREHITGHVVEPPEVHAWGGIAQAAKRAGLIEMTGAMGKDKWGSPKPLYRRVVR